MPSFIVRPYEPRDREGFGIVRSRVYRGGEPVLPDERLLRDDSTGYVVEADGQIVGQATVLDMTCSRGGKLHRCAGVASVAVLPEWRGSGAGSALMRGVIDMSAEAGYEVSTLHPYRDSWYRRFGYQGFGTRLQVHCPSDRLSVIPGELDPVREINAADWCQLEPVSQVWAQRYNGFNIRTADQWWRTLGGNTPLAIYVVGDPVAAYAVVRLKWDFWIEQEVKEFLWADERSYRSMLAFFRSLAVNKSGLSWPEPGDSPYMRKHYDRGVRVEVLGPLMYRLLGVPEAEAEERTAEWLGDPARVYCADAF